MISRVDGVGFSGIKPVNKKVMRNLVNANKQAPKGISKSPVRLEKNDDVDLLPMGIVVGTLGSWAVAGATYWLGRTANAFS